MGSNPIARTNSLSTPTKHNEVKVIPDKGLFQIIDIQSEIAKTIPLTDHKQVDVLPIAPKRKSKALLAARREYNDNANKARKAVFDYNVAGIAKHGLPWLHMNYAKRLAWFKEMLQSDQRMPSDVIKWAKQRGLMK